MTTRLILPETFAVLKKHLPEFNACAPFARLTEALIFGGNRDEDDGGLIADFRTLARLEGKEHQIPSRNYSGTEFLEKYSNQVCKLDIRGPRYTERKARTVKAFWPEAVARAIEAELKAAPSERRAKGLRFDSGQRPGKSTQSRYAKAALDNARKDVKIPPEHPAAELLKYLNTLPSNVFTTVILRNLDAARAVAEQQPDEESRRRNLGLLHSIEAQPVPVYQPSPQDRTARIFGYGESLLGLSTPVRKRLLAGCLECDLKAAQLAIVARLWRCERLAETLRRCVVHGSYQPESVWKHLAEGAGLDPERDKRAIKTAVYATVFGMRRDRIPRHLARELPGDPQAKAKAQRLLDSPILGELLAARDTRLSEVERAGFVETIFGKRVYMDEDRDPKSLLAEEIQAEELKLMLPLFEWVKKQPELKILAWQHDGFTLHVGNRGKTEEYRSKLHQIVRQTARKHQSPNKVPLTDLEIENLT